MPIQYVPKIQFKGKAIIILVVIIAAILLVLDGFVSVPAGHVAVVFDQGRGVLERELNEGLHLKIPIWQSTTIMDARTQEYTMSMVGGEGALLGDDSIESRSRDGQVVFIDATILFHIEKEKADLIKRNLGNEFEYSQKIIRPRAREKIREVIAKYNSLDLVSDKREEIVKEMNEKLKKSFSEHNLILEEILLRNVTFSPEFAKAIEEKQVAFQQIKVAEYRKQEAEELKQKKIIEAEAEAESIKIKGETLRANPQIIQLEFVQKMAPGITWGILPDNIIPLLDFKNQ